MGVHVQGPGNESWMFKQVIWKTTPVWSSSKWPWPKKTHKNTWSNRDHCNTKSFKPGKLLNVTCKRLTTKRSAHGTCLGFGPVKTTSHWWFQLHKASKLCMDLGPCLSKIKLTHHNYRPTKTSLFLFCVFFVCFVPATRRSLTLSFSDFSWPTWPWSFRRPPIAQTGKVHRCFCFPLDSPLLGPRILSLTVHRRKLTWNLKMKPRKEEISIRNHHFQVPC